MKRRFSSLTRRPAALLEVIIAFALVALCVLPLIYPHVFILRSEKRFIDEAMLDHRVNLFYADIMQKLYQKEIPWNDIMGGKEIPIVLDKDSSLTAKTEFPFKGTYRFQKVRMKESDDAAHSVHLLKLIMTFTPEPGYFPGKNVKPLVYEYQVMIERKQKE